MKKTILTTSIVAATLGLAATTASAQDWSGPYVGGTLGKSNMESTWTDVDGDWGPVGGKIGTYKGDNTAFGLELGYNWQSGNLVYGVAGGFTYQDVSNTTFEFADVYIDNSLSFTMDLRGTFGYAINQYLPYLTAGVAMSDLEHSWHEINDTPDSWPDFGNEQAVVYGVGLDYAYSPKVTIGAQYLMYDFGEERQANPTNWRMDVDTEMSRFAATVRYHF